MATYMEVYSAPGVTTAKAKNQWGWRRIVNSKITADNFGFDSRSNAMAAAKGDVRSVCKAGGAKDVSFSISGHKVNPLWRTIKWSLWLPVNL